MFKTPSFLKHPDMGIFLFRLAVGGLMLTHGVQGLQAGEATWSYLGQAMTHLGINFAFPLWGLMAVITQAFGGLCFLLGLFFRWACFALALTMAVAILYHWKKGDSLIMEGGQAVLFFSVFIAFMFIGAGKISICKDSCCGSRCDCAHKESDKCNNNDDHTGCCC